MLKLSMMHYFRIAAVGALFIFIVSFTYTTSVDFEQDLGRHIALGTIIETSGKVPHTNLFSYTNSHFPFVNHHWMPEVIFARLFLIGGIAPLTFLKTVLILGAVGCVFYAVSSNGIIAAVTAAFICVPLLVERADIRPELFGYLYFSIVLALLLHYPHGTKRYYSIPLIMLLWVNTHITFVFGVFLIGLFWIASWIYKVKSQKTLIIVTVLSMIALVINPNGIGGALYPLRIFGNYGYSIVENQNLFFLSTLLSDPLIRYTFGITPIILIGIFYSVYQRRYLESILAVTFLTLTYYQLRHMPFLVLAAIPSLTILARGIKKNWDQYPLSRIYPLVLTGIIILSSFIFFTNWYYRTFDIDKTFGMGYQEEGKKGMDFVLQHHLEGRIFNNFDIGGYAIYKLYPMYRVFVDNRPEAYPKDFMQNTYITLQRDPNLRTRVFREYGIHTVIMNHTDQTPWAASFMTSIIHDPSWKLIYVDSTVIVLSDRSSLPDIRHDEQRLRNLIDHSNTSLSLLKLTGILQLLDRNDLAQAAFSHAASLNPDSCTIQKNRYASKQISNAHAEAIKQEYWYCF